MIWCIQFTILIIPVGGNATGQDSPGFRFAHQEFNWIKDYVFKRYPTCQKEKVAHRLIRECVCQRVEEHRPLQYILGSQPFFGIPIICRPPVFIPRSETEQWVEWFYETHLRSLHEVPLCLLDLCTGSGCVGLSLAKKSPSWKVTCVEQSNEAISLANENMRTCNAANANILQGDMFQALEINNVPLHSFDCILSNPPYITPEEYQDLPPVVRLHEDCRSLVGTKKTSVNGSLNPLLYYSEIASQSRRWLKPLRPRGMPDFVVEIGTQAQSVETICRDNKHESVYVHNDYSGRPRWIVVHS